MAGFSPLSKVGLGLGMPGEAPRRPGDKPGRSLLAPVTPTMPPLVGELPAPGGTKRKVRDLLEGNATLYGGTA